MRSVPFILVGLLPGVAAPAAEIREWFAGGLQNSATGGSLQAGKIGFRPEGAPFELRPITMAALD